MSVDARRFAPVERALSTYERALVERILRTANPPDAERWLAQVARLSVVSECPCGGCRTADLALDGARPPARSAGQPSSSPTSS